MQPPEIEIVFKEIFASSLCCADRRTAIMLSGLWKANGTLSQSSLEVLGILKARYLEGKVGAEFRIARPEDYDNASV